MQYHLRTLLLATGLLAVWLSLIEFEPMVAYFFLGVAIMYCLAFPVVILGIGLVAAPQKGSYLDVASLRHFATFSLIWKWCMATSVLIYGLEVVRSGIRY
jgi:hypothetical protein